MWKFVLCVLAIINFECFKLSGANNATLGLNLKNQKFQINFIDELNTMVDRVAHGQLDALLLELQGQTQYAAYNAQIHTARSAEQLAQKIVYLKQLLDLKLNEQWHTMENFYTLRNLSFLSKLKKQLKQLQDESAHELRQLRWYNLCKQFWFREPLNGNNNGNTKGAGDGDGKTAMEKAGALHYPTTKMAPLQSAETSSQLPPVTINVAQFGRDLYASVKAVGAEIIDDYLLTIRKLLQEVIEEKHEHELDIEHAQHTAKLSKVLTEIDAILAVADFYQKRQRLYAYLEHDLAADYEQFKNSAYAQEDLAIILAKLQGKGLDLFVTFIFSNFEFLERLHESWQQLLPAASAAAAAPYDEQSQRLFRVHQLYMDFKRDWENSAKYEAYMAEVKALHTQTQQDGEHMHVFELLHNASANVGSVTFNMIKTRCDEI